MLLSKYLKVKANYKVKRASSVPDIIFSMCGRFSLDQYPDTIIKALNVGPVDFKPRSQVYPTSPVDVVFRGDDGNEIAVMTWGWERPFSKRPLINARSAEAWEKRTWSKALRERRCIIPVSGFFEWDENQPAGKRDRYRINPAFDDGFAFGGLYEINSATGEMFMSILTTGPNKKMAKIHHRMPVILDKDEFNAWFEAEDREKIEYMMQPANEDWVELVKEN